MPWVHDLGFETKIGLVYQQCVENEFFFAKNWIIVLLLAFNSFLSKT